MSENRIEESGMFHGLEYEVVATSMGHRCGYVRIPEGHPLHGLEYSDPAPGVSREELADEQIGKRGAIPVFISALDEGRRVAIDVLFNVHGSVTWSASRKNTSGDWWLGFDCAHSGDNPDPALMTQAQRMDSFRWSPDGVVRSLDYVRSECESLARQIVERYPLESQEAAQ